MRGIDANTGKAISGLAHLRQSIRDVLATPIGSRVMRREYGSQIFGMTDAPLNRSTLMDLYAATSEALARWEPRFRLSKVSATQSEAGKVLLDLRGDYLPDGQEVTIEGIEVN